jgi:predicted Zn-dependent protease
LDQALALAKRAVELDDGQETCLAALGFVQMCRSSFDLAQHYYTRALALNPNNPTVLANLGGLYVCLGDPAKGMDYLKEAKVVDPFFAPKWYWGQVGRAYFVTHQYDDAIAAFARYPSTRVWGLAYLAACCALTGNIDGPNIMPRKSFASCLSSQFRAMCQRSCTGFQATANI